MYKGKKLLCFFCVVFLLIGICGCKSAGDDETKIDISIISNANTNTDTDTNTVTDASDNTDTDAVVDVMDVYEDYLETKAKELLQYGQGKYGYYDINGDGTKELIIRNLDRLFVVACVDGEAQIIYNMDHSTLLANGMIRHYLQANPLGNPLEEELYCFYRYNEDQYELEMRAYRLKDHTTLGTEEDSYLNVFFGEDDTYYEMAAGIDEDYESISTDGISVSMDEWMEDLEKYLEIPAADITFTDFGWPEEQYESEEEAYQAFLEGKCSMTVQGYHADDAEGISPDFKEGEEYCLYDFFDMQFHGAGEEDNMYSNYGTAVSYAYIDCGKDGSKELAVQFDKYVGIDEFFTTYIIEYEDSRLYLRYGMNAWARNRKTMNQYGYVEGFGSNGADQNMSEEYVVGSDGKITSVLEREDTGMYAPDFYSDSEMVSNLLEAATEWQESNGKDADGGNRLDGMGISLYTLGENEYFAAYYDEESAGREDYESFLQSCEDKGITFYSEEEIENLIYERKETLGVAELEEGQEISWITFQLF